MIARLFFIFWIRSNIFRDFLSCRRSILISERIIRFVCPLAFQCRIRNCSTAKTCEDIAKRKRKVENDGKGGGMTHWRCVYQLVQYIADMLKKLLSLKLTHRLCIVPLGTSCNKILFHKSSILAVKMTIYWISYEVQKESQ